MTRAARPRPNRFLVASRRWDEASARAGLESRATAFLACVLALGGAACGDDAGGPAAIPDGGVGNPDSGTIVLLDSGTLSEAMPAPPTAPAAPQMGACDEGMEALITRSGHTVCVPWVQPEDGDCTGLDARFPGRPACERVGTPCPSDGLPPAPSDGEFVYVSAELGDDEAGDGSRAMPYRTLARGVARAPDGATVLVGRGRYTERFAIEKPVSVVGACVAETVLTTTETAPTSGPNARGVLHVLDVPVTLRNLSVQDAPTNGLTVDPSGGELTLEDVALLRVTSIAVRISGGTLTARRLLVRDTRPDTGGEYGRGVQFVGRSRGTIDQAVFERGHASGLLAAERANVTLTRVAIRDLTAEPATGFYANGLSLQGGARIDISRSILERNQENGINALENNTKLTATDVVIRDARTLPNGLYGRGISVADGPEVTLERVFIDHTAGHSISIAHGTLVGHDVILENVLGGNADGARSLNFQEESTVELERLSIAGAASVGVYVSNSAVTLRDFGADELGECGLFIKNRAHVNLERGRLTNLGGVGIVAESVGTEAVLTDVSVAGVSRGPTDYLEALGRGVHVQLGADLTLRRVAIDRVRFAGLTAIEGANVDAADVRVSNVDGDEEHGERGRGVTVETSSHASFTRLAVADARDIGIYAWGEGTTVTFDGLMVDETHAQACADSTCAERPNGSALGVYDGATVTAENFSLLRSSLCGVHFTPPSTLSMTGGVVRANTIGLCAPAGGSLDDVATGVRFFENERNLDSRSLPVPDATQALAGFDDD